MTTRTVLWHPEMRPPDSWLRRALIYEDRVASITAPDLSPQSELGSAYQPVFQEELVVQSSPAALVRRLEEELELLVEDHRPSGLVRSDWRAFVRSEGSRGEAYIDNAAGVAENWRTGVEDARAGGAPSKTAQDGWDRLWLAKLPDDVSRELERLGFVRHEDCLYAPEEVVQAVLDATAQFYCQAQPDDWITSTDSIPALTSSFSPVEGDTGTPSVFVGYDVPVPTDNVPVEEVVSFRQTYEKELTELRQLLRASPDEDKTSTSQRDVVDGLAAFKRLMMELCPPAQGMRYEMAAVVTATASGLSWDAVEGLLTRSALITATGAAFVIGPAVSSTLTKVAFRKVATHYAERDVKKAQLSVLYELADRIGRNNLAWS